MKGFLRTATLLFSFAHLANSAAQNLVPNGSFEQHDFCPDEGNQFSDNVLSWSRCPGTPDYFNECASGSQYGVPSNRFGYQWASEGVGYAGLVTYVRNAAHSREFIFATLETPLVVAAPVYLSMKVALGAFGDEIPPVGWTSKGIGMRLSTQPFEWVLETPFPNAAQLHLEEVLLDTLNWVSLSTVYIPDSAYRFITIGNFFQDSLSSPLALDSMGLGSAYVFLDEICVSNDQYGCDQIDQIADREETEPWRVVSPFSERLELWLGMAFPEPVQIALFDAGGRLSYIRTVPMGQRSIVWDVAGLKDGLYVMALLSQDVIMKPMRLVKLSP